MQIKIKKDITKILIKIHKNVKNRRKRISVDENQKSVEKWEKMLFTKNKNICKIYIINIIFGGTQMKEKLQKHEKMFVGGGYHFTNITNNSNI